LPEKVMNMEAQKRVNFGLTLKKTTLSILDEVRGDIPRTRWIERAVEERLKKLRGDP
jgi:hypothetical protein